MTRDAKIKQARRREPPPPAAPRVPRRLVLFAAAGVVGALVAGMLVWRAGGDDETFSGLPVTDPGPVHVHGLGVDPADDSLFIATHSGLYRVGADERKAERVGERFQDTMGFTIVGPNRFLGSGHPDVNEAREQGLPSRLGLIESTDAGQSWRNVSLPGEADFHVLRFAGRRVYGYDASNDRLLVSADRGRTWDELAKPGPIVDLAVDPADARHILVSSAGGPVDGLFESRTGGNSWSRIGDAAGLLAWPRRDRLYIVAGGGLVFVSADRGRRLRQRGQIGGEPAALLARDANELYVALHDGTIQRTVDGGATWTVRSTPS